MPNLLCVVASCLLAQSIYVWQSTPEDIRLSGRIITPSGEPVPAADVSLHTSTSSEPLTLGHATSGPDGRFAFEIAQFPDRSQTTLRAYLEVEAARFAPTRLERVYVPPPAYDMGDVVVEPPVELHGVVVTQDGNPVAGAKIRAAIGPVDGLDPYRAPRTPIAISDEHGAFTCRVLPPGKVTLGVEAARLADFELETRDLVRGENEVRFVMRPARSVDVRVTGPDGAPIANAMVQPSNRGPATPDCKPSSPSTFGFWRGPLYTDTRGVAVVDGLAEDARANVTVSAQGMRPEWARIEGPELDVKLQRTIRVDVTARHADGSTATIYQVGVRDVTGPRSWCGNCEDVNWRHGFADSSWVRVISADHWEIEWNTLDSIVRGGRPSEVAIGCDDGTRGGLELDAQIQPGSTVPCRVTIEDPGSITGRVVDADGNPLALRIGLQIGFERPDLAFVTSNADGSFRFDRTQRGFSWFHSLDAVWEFDHDGSAIEWKDQTSLTDVLLRAHSQPKSGAGTVRVRVTIDGKVPSRPVLLALDDIGQDLPDSYPRDFGWTDAEGRVKVTSMWPRAYHIVPKRTAVGTGGWRDFGGEFPDHDQRWPWKVEVPEDGAVSASIDFPAEAEWSRYTPMAR